MSDEKHTKEPWELRKFDGEAWPQKRVSVSEAMGQGNALFINARFARNYTEDARRIVAAVNACAGIPTEELERAAAQPTPWRRLDSLSEEAAFYANKEDLT